LADSEDALQISVRKLETVTTKYGLKIAASKTKTVSFKGTDPVISKIVINDDIIEQINTEVAVAKICREAGSTHFCSIYCGYNQHFANRI
jgi:hypothetical protein